jgi:hypothetical protein
MHTLERNIAFATLWDGMPSYECGLPLCEFSARSDSTPFGSILMFESQLPQGARVHGAWVGRSRSLGERTWS